MQPYFFPYIGYFQLMNYVDNFILYDEIKYTKGGWINRNRISLNGNIISITIPISKDSSKLNIDQRYIADIWPTYKNKLLNKFIAAYNKAYYFEHIIHLIENIFNYEDIRLDKFLFNSISQIKNYLDIKTNLVISSEIENNNVDLKGEERVIGLVKACKGIKYINLSGGKKLYSKNTFKNQGIELQFLASDLTSDSRLFDSYVPNLSIIDLLMHNSKQEMKIFLSKFKLS